MSRARTALLFALALAIATPGCFVFDESLYRAREDAGGGGIDGGLGSLALAEDCTAASTVEVAELHGGATSWIRSFDTRGLADDYTNLSCTGRPSPGPEGLFAIDMQAGERWHIHVRRRTDGADPVLFVLPRTCDERGCDRPLGLDACRADSDEHLSLVATTTGRYYVGIDSANAGGFAGTVEVFRPVCGNGVQEHGESCEPGVDPTITCNDECRVVLSNGASEREVNDDAFMANELDLASGTISISGRVGALCEIDVYAVDVPAGGGSIRASLRTAGGADCPASTPSTELQLVGEDGIVVLGTGTARGASACPSIEATDTFANDLAEGRYYLRVYALNDEVSRPFDYSLQVELISP